MRIYDLEINENKTIPSIGEVVTDEWVNQIISTNTWVDHGSTIDGYLNDFDINLSDEDLFDHLKNEWLPKRYKYAVTQLQHDIQKSSTIHRAIRVNKDTLDNIKKSVANKKPHNVGKYWSIGAPDTYGDDGKNDMITIVLMKKLNTKEINWIETIRSRMDFDNGDDEHEIQLQSDTTIVDGIEME